MTPTGAATRIAPIAHAGRALLETMLDLLLALKSLGIGVASGWRH